MNEHRPPLIRATQSDVVWTRDLHDYIGCAIKSRHGILIENLYEQNATVPQRLYRFDLFDDYVSRHRDDFEFGFHLITRIQTVDSRRTFGVYIVELSDSSNHLYVGQSWYTPAERLRQHLTGYAVFHAARPFKRGLRGKLRPDLYSHLPKYFSQEKAEALEAQTAMELKKAGFRVEGGH